MRRPDLNSIECDLGTSVRFPAKIAMRDITSIIAAPKLQESNRKLSTEQKVEH